MTRTFTERQQAILAYLGRHGATKAEALAGALRVSAPTIRRDLALLHGARAIARFHGGVAPVNDLARRPFPERRAENVALKLSLARAVAAMVQPGSALFLGTGTTMEQVAMALPGDLALTVVTASIFTAAALLDRPGVDLHVLGGRALGSEGNLSGSEPLRALQNLRFDLALVSFAGFDEDGAPMDFDIEHHAIKHQAMRNARRVVAAADHTKFGRRALVRVGRLDELDALVTSAPPPDPLRAAFDRAGVEVVVAPRDAV